MPQHAVRRRAALGLDAFNGLAAAVQTGFGAFVPLYLAGAAWGQAAIGLALSVQTLASMALQVPGGALVDASHRRRTLLAAAIGTIGLAAAVLAALPFRVPVLLALVLQAGGAAVMAPAIAALSLSLVGQPGLAERLGRNARFASLGSALAAAGMGGLALLAGQRAVFVLAALLALPAIWSLHYGTARAHLGEPEVLSPPPPPSIRPSGLLHDRGVLVFLACVVLFHLASAAILAVAAPDLARRAGPRAGLLIAAFIIVPQLVVALLSPLVGRLAERWGRRRLMLIGWGALPLRALLFLLIGNPLALVPVQMLEGLSSAVFGVLMPLVAADLTRKGGRYNLCMGVLGLAGAGGAAASTALAGVVAGLWGRTAGFATLAAIGVAASLVVFLAMPETKEGK